MKLNNGMRDTIVSRIMSDVPMIDYKAQMKTIADAEAYQQLPIEIRVAIERNPDVRNYLGTCYVGYNYHEHVLNRHYEPSEETKVKLAEIEELRKEQNDRRYVMIKKIRGALNACTTVGKFVKMFPEFEKYVPIQDAPITNLPANQIMTELMTMGWPDNKKEEVKAPE